MSLGKESPSHHLLTAGTRPEHLVCAEPLCPTSSDPYTGRITCRCYQLSDSRESTPGGLAPHIPSAVQPQTQYPGIYPHSYSLDAASPVSASLAPPGGRWDPSMFAPGYPSPFPAGGAAAPQVENMLRSQMYNYMYPAMFDLSGARRKNATRETTSALKAWLQEHRKNPYPTKAEKIMLAIVTKMTLTQVSTWFANARRRLKKETKGDWSLDSSLDTSAMSSDEDEKNSDDLESKDEIAQRLGQVPEVSQNQISPGMAPFQSSTGNSTLPGFSSFTQTHLQDANFSHISQSSPLISGQIPSVFQNSHHYKPGQFQHRHEYSLTNTYSSGQSETTNLSESDDSDKENTDILKTTDSSNSVPHLPKPRIWSISDIMGGGNAQKNDSHATNDRRSAENTSNAI